MRISALAVVLMAAGGAWAQPTTATTTSPVPKTALVKFDTGGAGFIDDAYALRDDGKAIAYITTDGATAATLHLAEVGGKNVEVAGAPTDALAVAWLTPAKVLAALRAGEFDKERDMRRPDRYTRLDAFGGKVIVESEVKDVLGFTQVALLRRDQPNMPVIVHFSDDRKKLMLLDGIDDGEVKLSRELWKYDVASLQSQLVDDKRVAVSLTNDPVNPDAVARKKADPDDIDLYDVDRATRAATLRLRLPGQGRPSSWRVAGNRLLLLRKDKGFDRGGVALELYDL
jgi:hypothetical protein